MERIHFRPTFWSACLFTFVFSAGLGFEIANEGRLPTAIGTNTNKAIAALQLGEPGAKEQLELAISIRPDLAPAYHAIANDYADRGDLTGVLQTYGRLLDVRPGDFDARNGRAHVLYRAGRRAEALAEFELLVEHNPRRGMGHYDLGVVQMGEGQLERAEESFRRASELLEDPRAFNNLGVALRRQGEVSESIRAFEKALALAPMDPRYRQNLIDARNDLKGRR